MNKVFSKWAKEYDPTIKPQFYHAFCKTCDKWVYEMKVKSGHVFCMTCKEIVGPADKTHYQLKQKE